MKARLPSNEGARLETLRQYSVLDTEAEESFDDLTRLASTLCDTPVALISLVDSDRQWFKAKVGIDLSETERDISFCAHAILEDGPLVVRDALDDDRFRDNQLVLQEPYIRFYAGSPLTSPEGFKIGTLCVMDYVPRNLEAEQLGGLRMLANQAIALLELRRQVGFLSRALEVHRRVGKALRGWQNPLKH